MENFSVFVNTTDSFEDCWTPFFILFKKFWPDYSGTIYLNTETKTYHFEGLNIISIQNNKNSWSESVRTALIKMDEDYLLYLQDDYFFKDSVKTNELNQYFHLMKIHNINCLHLTDQHSSGPFLKTDIPDLLEISYNAKDRVSCQAAFWKKNTLLKYLYPNETGWHFETYGTMRSHYIHDRFFAIDHNIVRLNSFEIIPYIFTGIVKGQWWHEVKALFAANNIDINFSKRGFFHAPNKLSFQKKVIEKLKRQPKYWLTVWEIILIVANNNKKQL